MEKRLQQFISAENLTQSQFADSIGVAKASVSHILAGRNKPGFDFIEGVAKCYPDLSMEWLITGKGRMYKSQTVSTASAVQQDIVFNETDAPADDTPQAGENSNSEGKNARRSISRILVLYDDGSYDELSGC